MKDITITIPDNCELIKDGNTYVVREKKQVPPRSWREFCENCPRTANEYFIGYDSSIGQIFNTPCPRDAEHDKNICSSKEEAKAFLALMQLRQLRKAWVGDWEPDGMTDFSAIRHDISYGRSNVIASENYHYQTRTLSFPTKEMAKEFLECFRDLCETAKCLL